MIMNHVVYEWLKQVVHELAVGYIFAPARHCKGEHIYLPLKMRLRFFGVSFLPRCGIDHPINTGHYLFAALLRHFKVVPLLF